MPRDPESEEFIDRSSYWEHGMCDCISWGHRACVLSFFCTGEPFAVIMYRTGDRRPRCGLGYQSMCCLIWTGVQIFLPLGVCPLTLLARRRARRSLNIHQRRDLLGDCLAAAFLPQFVIGQTYDTVQARTLLQTDIPAPPTAPRVVNSME